MIRSILFDLDETLLNRTETVRHFLAEQHQRFDPVREAVSLKAYVETFLKLDGHGYIKKDIVYPQLVEEFALDVDWRQLLADYEDKRRWHHFILFPNVEEYLHEKREAGYKLGIITNGSVNSQQPKIDQTGLDKLVDTYLISEREQVRKPEPEIFLRAAKRLDVATTECIFVGDNPQADILGAQQVGMKAVWFQGHLPWPAEVENQPDYTISKFEELFPLLPEQR